MSQSEEDLMTFEDVLAGQLLDDEGSNGDDQTTKSTSVQEEHAEDDEISAQQIDFIKRAILKNPNTLWKIPDVSRPIQNTTFKMPMKMIGMKYTWAAGRKSPLSNLPVYVCGKRSGSQQQKTTSIQISPRYYICTAQDPALSTYDQWKQVAQKDILFLSTTIVNSTRCRGDLNPDRGWHSREIMEWLRETRGIRRQAQALNLWQEYITSLWLHDLDPSVTEHILGRGGGGGAAAAAATLTARDDSLTQSSSDESMPQPKTRNKRSRKSKRSADDEGILADRQAYVLWDTGRDEMDFNNAAMVERIQDYHEQKRGFPVEASVLKAAYDELRLSSEFNHATDSEAYQAAYTEYTASGRSWQLTEVSALGELIPRAGNVEELQPTTTRGASSKVLDLNPESIAWFMARLPAHEQRLTL